MVLECTQRGLIGARASTMPSLAASARSFISATACALWPAARSPNMRVSTAFAPSRRRGSCAWRSAGVVRGEPVEPRSGAMKVAWSPM